MWYRFYKKMLNTASVIALAVGLMSTPSPAEASGIFKVIPTNKTQARKLVKKRIIKSSKKPVQKRISKSKGKAPSKKRVIKRKIVTKATKKIALKNVKSKVTQSTITAVKPISKVSNLENIPIKPITTINSLPIQKEASAGVQSLRTTKFSKENVLSTLKTAKTTIAKLTNPIATSIKEKIVSPVVETIADRKTVISETKSIFSTITNNQSQVLESTRSLEQAHQTDKVADVLEAHKIDPNVDDLASIGSQIGDVEEVTRQAVDHHSVHQVLDHNAIGGLGVPQGSDIPAPPPIGGMSSQGKVISNAPKGSDIPSALPISGLLSHSKKVAELTVKKQADVTSVTQATGSDHSDLFQQIRQGKPLKKAEANLKVETLDDQIKLGISLKKTNLTSIVSEDELQGNQSQNSISPFNDSHIIQPKINKLKSDIELYKKNLEILQSFDDEEIIEDAKMKELKEFSSRRGAPLEDILQQYIEELESKLEKEEEVLKKLRLNGAKENEEFKTRKEATSQTHVINRDPLLESSANKPTVATKEKVGDSAPSLHAPKNKPPAVKTVTATDRSGLLDQIKGGHSLKKTIIEKSTPEKPVGGRDSLLETIRGGVNLKKAATKDNKQDINDGSLTSAFKKVIPVSSKKMEITSLVDAEKALITAQKKLNSFDRDFYDDAIEADKKEQNLKSKVAKAQETIEKFKKLPVKSNHPDRDDH